MARGPYWTGMEVLSGAVDLLKEFKVADAGFKIQGIGADANN